MVRHRGTVLVDTNVILEAHRTKTWRALTGGYRVETVEECVIETQTGFQLRREELQIYGGELRDRLSTVHTVEGLDRAKLAIKAGNIALDEGEAALLAHALSRTDDWVLCGPDKASLRCGMRLGFRERLVSMQELLDAAGVNRPSVSLRKAYTKTWHQKTLGELVFAERLKRE